MRLLFLCKMKFEVLITGNSCLFCYPLCFSGKKKKQKRRTEQNPVGQMQQTSKERTIMFVKQQKLTSYLSVKCEIPENLSALFFWKHSHAIVVGVAECLPCGNTNLYFEWKPSETRALNCDTFSVKALSLYPLCQ